jgi:phosphoribosylformylglycinamidine cyclo-ligase
MARAGNVPEREMYRTFNMGVGMVIVASKQEAERVKAHLDSRGESHYDIGRVVAGSKDVRII